MSGQPIAPVASSIRINHDTGGADNLRVCDDNLQPLAGVFIGIFAKAPFDAGLFAELGFARTGEDGRWLDDVLLDVLEDGRTMYARIRRPPGYVRGAEGLFHRNEYSTELIEFLAADTPSAVVAPPGEPLVRFFQVLATTVVATVYTTVAGVGAELRTVVVAANTPGKVSLYLVPFGGVIGPATALMDAVSVGTGTHIFEFDQVLEGGGDSLAVLYDKVNGATVTASGIEFVEG